MSIAEHKGHRWYNKGHPDGSSSADGWGIIVCKDCNERLYYGRLPQAKSQLGPGVTEDEAVRNLPHGWDNRTIDDIWSLRPPHINSLASLDIQEVTAANMPNRSGDGINPGGLSVVADVVDPMGNPITEAKEAHPSTNGAAPMDSESVEVVQVGATYSLTAHFSRTIKEPGADFGSITCGFDIAETYPGDIDVERLVTLAGDQFTAIKALVLTQLGLPFTMDEEGVIKEAFPGSQTVSRTSAQNAPSAPAPSRGSGRTSGGSPASTGQRGRSGGASRGRQAAAPTVVPDQAELWYELVESPGEWFWNQEKQNPRAADFLSTKYYKDDGWPVSLWESQANGTSNLPDDADWFAAYDAIPADNFAQTMPRKRD